MNKTVLHNSKFGNIYPSPVQNPLYMTMGFVNHLLSRDTELDETQTPGKSEIKVSLNSAKRRIAFSDILQRLTDSHLRRAK